MGGAKVPRDNGYNINEFVAADEDALESQDEISSTSSDDSDAYEPAKGGNDDDSDEEAVKPSKKRSSAQKTPKKSAINTPSPRNAYVTPSKSPKGTGKAGGLKRKMSLSPAPIDDSPRSAKKVAVINPKAKDEELDEIIGKESSTDSDDVGSDFAVAGGSSDDGDEAEVEGPPKANVKVKRTTETPVKAQTKDKMKGSREAAKAAPLQTPPPKESALDPSLGSPVSVATTPSPRGS
ncbi:MAG: hypothetical protein M1828_005502 [Chrysothrix sp. TS-e1954]|nr:MAG: hypothetical protein M1828_005502 [Chrysothrix sp. TS-e1954]